MSALLIQQATQARRDKRLADAHRGFVEAVALCRKAGTKRELIQALTGLGQIERDLGRLDRAQTLYEEAVALCRQHEDTLILAHTLRHLGDIHRSARQAELAEPCYREALALYRSNEQTPPVDLANALRPLAILREGQGEIDEARALWEQARNLYEAAGVEGGVAESSVRLKRLRGHDSGQH